MPTYNRRNFISRAIEYFLRQDYHNCELIIIDDGSDYIKDLVPNNPQIAYRKLAKKHTVGAKRNIACEAAKGEIIVHWDDDDWMSSNRLSYQVASLLETQSDICGLDNLLFYDIRKSKSLVIYIFQRKNSLGLWRALCYRKSFWSAHPFANINLGEDNYFVWSSALERVKGLDDNSFYIALIHKNNASPKYTFSRQWSAYPLRQIKEHLKNDWDFYASLQINL